MLNRLLVPVFIACCRRLPQIQKRRQKRQGRKEFIKFLATLAYLAVKSSAIGEN